jgi:hypothetical protein
MMRYFRAFVVALRMTLRGEQPPPPKHGALRQWMKEAVRLTDAVISLADANGMPLTAREELRLIIDRRPISMETILKAVRYHLIEEYPHVLKHDEAHGLTAVYSSNLNDQFRVARLAEVLEKPAVKRAAQALAAHLAAIPSTTDKQ